MAFSPQQRHRGTLQLLQVAFCMIDIQRREPCLGDFDLKTNKLNAASGLDGCEQVSNFDGVCH